MCYAELGDVLAQLERMDADVVSLEASRSHMEVLDELAGIDYRAAVGPGVYDIHSPRVPSAAEIGDRLALAETRIERGRLWVNPDCGLKTRRWDEVEPALRALVEAARARRWSGVACGGAPFGAPPQDPHSLRPSGLSS